MVTELLSGYSKSIENCQLFPTTSAVKIRSGSIFIIGSKYSTCVPIDGVRKVMLVVDGLTKLSTEQAVSHTEGSVSVADGPKTDQHVHT